MEEMRLNESTKGGGRFRRGPSEEASKWAEWGGRRMSGRR